MAIADSPAFSIAGGGDSAVDWALSLSEVAERAVASLELSTIARHALEFYSSIWFPYQFPQLTLQDGLPGLQLLNLCDERGRRIASAAESVRRLKAGSGLAVPGGAWSIA